MRLLVALLFSLTLFRGYGQGSNQIIIGTRDSVYSKILKEERNLLIYLPPDYNNRNKYPAVYLLDGEDYFRFFTGIVNHLGSSNVIPEMIVIGIVNTNRNRDLTPSHDVSNYDTSNGGGELFTSFFENELIPYVESNYSTAPYRMFVGHSIGGLLVVNTLLNHTSLFSSYIALDPALWWDKMKLVNQSSATLEEKKFKNKGLFLAISNSMPAGMTDIAQAKKDTTVATIGIRSELLFEDKLKKAANTDLRFRSKYYPDEFHASVPLIGCYDALKFIFDFYRRPSFQKLTDSTATVLENHFKMVSERMGYKVLPSESDLAGLAWRSRVLENNFDRALTFLQLYVRLYPESAAAYDSMGQYYEVKGDAKKGKIYYEKAKQLREQK